MLYGYHIILLKVFSIAILGILGILFKNFYGRDVYCCSSPNCDDNEWINFSAFVDEVINQWLVFSCFLWLFLVRIYCCNI